MSESVLFFLIPLISLVWAANEGTLQKFVDGNKLFSAALYKQIAAKEENFMVSPFSAETILALAQNGAKGETSNEIRTVLHLPSSKRQTNSVFKTLLPKLKKNEEYTFETANKVYVKKNYPIKEHFNRTAVEIYNSLPESVDFSKNVEAAKAINEWVSMKTNDTIKDLINPENLNEDTIAVLVNALYFAANWKKGFKVGQTQKEDFYLNEDEVVQVDTMKKGDFFGYYESEDLDAKFLQMPFRGRNAHMVVVLPNTIDGLKKLEDEVEKVYKSAKINWEYVNVMLPKFKIETSIDFKKVLKNLGIKKAFNRADFSDLAGQKGEIYITDIVQKTFIEVDESGVEASGATAILFHPKSLMQDFGDKKTFKVDHPFLFYIKINDIIIFTGRVVSPTV